MNFFDLGNFKDFLARAYSLRWFLLANFGLFILTRIVFYFIGYLPCFNPDTATYYRPIQNLLQGIYPSFGMATPVYPAVLGFFTLSLNSNFFILLFNSFLTLLASSLLIVKARQLVQGKLFIPLACVLILFFSSGTVLLEETTVGPASMFSSIIVFFFITLQSIVRSSLTLKNALFLSFLIFIAILTRPQGLFLLFFVGAVCAAFLIRKKYFPLLLVIGFNIGLYTSISMYNKITGNGLTPLPNRLYLLSETGKNIHTLKKPQGLPADIAHMVDSVNSTFSKDHDNIIQNSWNYSDLKEQFTIANFDKAWAFYGIMQTNPDGIKMLIKASSGGFNLKAKYMYFVFFSYFDIYTLKNTFFDNYFNYRYTVFCETKELTMFRSPDKAKLCLKDFSVFTDSSIPEDKRDGYCAELNDKRTALYKNPLFKICSFIDNVSYYLLNNIVWPVLFFLCLLFGVYLFFKTAPDKRSTLITATISPLIIFGNIAVFMASIMPNSRYTLATAVFLYLFVFELISLYLTKRKQLQH